MLIAIRLHALIFSAVMRTPLIGISYDPKIDRFLETLGDQNAGTLENVTVEGLMAKITKLGLTTKHQRNDWEEPISTLRSKAFHNAELALELLAKQC
jgi:polysaccharide pyruvyl transferase WcaK-like protein